MNWAGFDAVWYAFIRSVASNMVFESKAQLLAIRITDKWTLLMIAIFSVIIFGFWNAQWRHGATCNWIIRDGASDFFFLAIKWAISWAWITFVIGAFRVAVIIFTASFWISSSGTQELIIFASNLTNQRTIGVGWALIKLIK